MENLNEVIFYTIEKAIKMYRKLAQSQITQNGYNITIDQCLVLKTLQENKSMQQNQIAEFLSKDIASITRIIELLVKKKYVVRKINDGDRRKFELKITNEGNQILKDLYPIVVEYRKKALKGLTINNVNFLKENLDRIINNCK